MERITDGMTGTPTASFAYTGGQMHKNCEESLTGAKRQKTKP